MIPIEFVALETGDNMLGDPAHWCFYWSKQIKRLESMLGYYARRSDPFNLTSLILLYISFCKRKLEEELPSNIYLSNNEFRYLQSYCSQLFYKNGVQTITIPSIGKKRLRREEEDIEQNDDALFHLKKIKKVY